MKRGIEINGVANIHMLMKLEVDKKPDGTFSMNEETYESIFKQLKFLEEYMKAYTSAVNNDERTPYWHEITKGK